MFYFHEFKSKWDYNKFLCVKYEWEYQLGQNKIMKEMLLKWTADLIYDLKAQLE